MTTTRSIRTLHLSLLFYLLYLVLLYRSQLTCNFDWARNQVATMQQTCVDEVLMANYMELNDTQSLYNALSASLEEILSVRCEPFDCNGNGSCISGSCVWQPGECFLHGVDVVVTAVSFASPEISATKEAGVDPDTNRVV